jgi:hypothetical protein
MNYEDCDVLGCDAVSFDRQVPVFRRNLPPSSICYPDDGSPKIKWHGTASQKTAVFMAIAVTTSGFTSKETLPL